MKTTNEILATWKAEKIVQATNELIAGVSSAYYHIYWSGDEAHISDGLHSVLIGNASEDIDELVSRIPMCERTLDNWQD